MTLQNKFTKWLVANKLQFAQDGLFFTNGEKSFMLVEDETKAAITEDLQINLSETEFGLAAQYKPDYFVFNFGGSFYYTPAEGNLNLKLFKYIGQARKYSVGDYVNLGVHGAYELMNGVGTYGDWIKKAAFFGHTALGLAEKNTLGGTLAFQMECDKQKIQPVIGETITISKDGDGSNTWEGKCYVMNAKGWKNLLLINTEINVHNEGWIAEKRLLELAEGLIFVFGTEAKLSTGKVFKFKKHFVKCFYQFNTTQFTSDEKDRTNLLALKNYLDNYTGILEPVLLNDCYYVDKEYADVKRMLNKGANVRFQNHSNDQHYKAVEDHYTALKPMFSDNLALLNNLVVRLMENSQEIAEACKFKIELGKFKLPVYEMTPEEKAKYKDNLDLFYDIIEKGMQRKVEAKGLDYDAYEERLVSEIKVIKDGGFIDYFLILWDIIRWCEQNEILVGVGRGSAGGSLAAYIMDITQIDPIPYGLLFERFLNPNRVKSGLPDIDVDFMGDRRDDVKRYMEEKYGLEYVTSVGTYTTLKAKGALKDLGRAKGIEHANLNYITAIIDCEGDDFTDFMREVARKPKLQEFAVENPDIINALRVCLNQPRSSSIHASAVVIVPKFDHDGNPINIYEWLPVRKSGGVLITEWEKDYVEAAGYLKEDILGVRQLDKFSHTLKLIDQNHGEKINLYEIPLNEKGVYGLFGRGLNEDVFQFGTTGLKQYCSEVKPTTIEELIAINALYRPAVMQLGAHKDYVKIKFKKQEAEFDFKLAEVTKETYGIYLYQEQIMLACVTLAGFTLPESDDVRKMLIKGKGDMEYWQGRFVAGSVANGCDPEKAAGIWEKLKSFSGYGFVKAHAAAYAITGYFSQWLKYMYPLEFWTTTLQFSKEEEVPLRINEIEKIGKGIKVAPPDVNKSTIQFEPDFQFQRIYWGLNKIKGVGDVAVTHILEEREKNGNFYSFKEFYNRVPKNKVNKKVVEALILAGAFDLTCELKGEEERYKILQEFYGLIREEMPAEFEAAKNSRNWWVLRQRTLTGFGKINYEEMVQSSGITKRFHSGTDVKNDVNLDNHATVSGIVIDSKVRPSKKGEFIHLTLNNNDELVHVTIWNKEYEKYKVVLNDVLNRIVAISGQVVSDTYRNQNVIHSRFFTEVKVIN